MALCRALSSSSFSRPLPASAGRYSERLLRPCDLTEYMAMSELRIRSATVAPSRGYSAMPTLAVTKHSCPPTKIGSRISSSTRMATRSASRSSTTSGSSATNSSPPRRPTASRVRCEREAMLSSEVSITWSECRTQERRRRATSISSSSPAPWPRVSLMTLKRSRSISSRPTWWPRRLACSSARSVRQISWRRLGRPVRASKLARWRILSSASRRSVTSCTMPV